jgi:hypothetical protein
VIEWSALSICDFFVSGVSAVGSVPDVDGDVALLQQF